ARTLRSPRGACRRGADITRRRGRREVACAADDAPSIAPPAARRACGRFWCRISPMIAGVRGRLITASFAGTELPAITGNCVAPPDTVRALEEWSTRRDAAFGPASSVRAIADGIALPLLKILGFTV